ncbi:MAG: glutamate synthase [Deltaproteobacteria bacterium]|nr:MAG: glutamate synthase [Deltaproteobacteria bacterium]
MCRLFAITSEEPLSPMMAIRSLYAMKEGYDGSGVGIFLTDLSGELEEFKGFPILSGIFTNDGIKKLDQFMMAKGFMTKHKMSIKPTGEPPAGTPKRDVYLIRAYEYPSDWEGLPEHEKQKRLMLIRIQLRKMGEKDGSMIVFSFWPDTIMIKEIGEPIDIAEYLGLDRKEWKARIMLVQGRQNTNYAITLYACHPFFIQGISTMTNGENTAFVPIKEFLISRNFPGYFDYQSDSEVFTHIMHYSMYKLGFGLDAYKHIITPLKDAELEKHPSGATLRMLKHSLRPLTIDGPNCVMGCLPDKTIFLVQDSKKLRPGVAGGKPGVFAFASEMCGLDFAIPDRDKTKDFQPMKYDTVFVGPDRKEMKKWTQWEPFNPTH